MSDAFPYRFTATEGMYAGQTFVYRGDGSFISYETDSPGYYHVTWPQGAEGVPAGTSWRHGMTPEALARFSAIPERRQQ